MGVNYSLINSGRISRGMIEVIHERRGYSVPIGVPCFPRSAALLSLCKS